jgi:hypothetical protein
MFSKSTDKAHINPQSVKGYQLFPLFVALIFALTMQTAKAHAQI